VAADGIQVEGRVGREIDLSAVDVQIFSFGSEALFVVIQDGWEQSKDLVLSLSQ
jgi:late competence protein required for DNA uptake (superfamily II DNA/RNA helicase)